MHTILDEKEGTGDFQVSGLANVFMKIGQNGGKIFEVKAYPVNDKEPVVKAGTAKAFSFTEINVSGITSDTTGYVKVNGTYDVPIKNLGSMDTTRKMYFYDREEAIEKVNSLNAAEYDYILERLAEVQKAADYLKSVVENGYN